MVDFRYHLVSLISVFLALSVGIILGAGPLQNSIGEALSGQVESLRETNADLKMKNDELSAMIDNNDEALTSLTPTLLADTLTGRVVSIVRTPEVTDETYDTATTSVQAAGASIGTSLTLTDMWISADQTVYRADFASQIADYVPTAAKNSQGDDLLVTALDQLVRKGTDEQANNVLLQLFTESDTPMITGVDKLGAEADVVLVLTPDFSAPEITDDKKADAKKAASIQFARDLYMKIIHASSKEGATVAVGAADSKEDTLTHVRSARTTSTVDSPDISLGKLNIAIAAAHEIKGETVNYGVHEGADAPLGQPIDMPKAPPAQEGDGADSDGENTNEDASGDGDSTVGNEAPVVQ